MTSCRDIEARIHVLCIEVDIMHADNHDLGGTERGTRLQILSSISAPNPKRGILAEILGPEKGIPSENFA